MVLDNIKAAQVMKAYYDKKLTCDETMKLLESMQEGSPISELVAKAKLGS